MRHVLLTCKHHPNLRWHCKSIAFSPGHGYNGQRHIFFLGEPTGDGGYKCAPLLRNLKHPDECKCPPTDLVLAPEEVEKQKTDPTYGPNGEDVGVA